MTVAHSVAEVSNSKVKLQVVSSYRMYLNGYLPQLQHDKGVVGFFHHHRGHTFACSALMKPDSERFAQDPESYVAEQNISMIRFEKGR